jgi:hypothetical protein
LPTGLPRKSGRNPAEISFFGLLNWIAAEIRQKSGSNQLFMIAELDCHSNWAVIRQ